MSNTLSNRPEASMFIIALEKIKKGIGVTAVVSGLMLNTSCAAESNHTSAEPAAQEIVIENGEFFTFVEYSEIGDGPIETSLEEIYREIDPNYELNLDTLRADAAAIDSEYRKLYNGIPQPSDWIAVYKQRDLENGAAVYRARLAEQAQNDAIQE